MPIFGAVLYVRFAIDVGSDARKSRKPPTCKQQVQFIRSNGLAVLIRQRINYEFQITNYDRPVS